MSENKRAARLWIALLCVLAVIFLIPIFLVLLNSFKSRLYISSEPFSLPVGDAFVGLENYLTGLKTAGFLPAFGRSLFITLASGTHRAVHRHDRLVYRPGESFLF